MKKAILITLALFVVARITAQVPPRAENNAALRYWNAFAQMSDATITDAQSRQLEAIANGTSAWDESAFGKLLDDNAQAVETMLRGTSFPYCAWGLDYQLGAATPIPQIPRGRALARLVDLRTGAPVLAVTRTADEQLIAAVIGHEDDP